jgi:hypothetical protein
MINKRDKDLLILLISRPWSIAISRRDNQLRLHHLMQPLLKSNSGGSSSLNRIFLKNSTIWKYWNYF